MRTKRFTVSIAFVLLSIFLINGATGFSLSCFPGLVNNTSHSLLHNNNTDDAEKVPEEKNLLAEEYVHVFEAVLITHPENFDAAIHKAVRNTYIPQAVYLSIPEPPPNGCFA